MAKSKLAPAYQSSSRRLIIPADLEDDILIISKEQNRSFNNMVVHILYEEVRKFKALKKIKEDRR